MKLQFHDQSLNALEGCLQKQKLGYQETLESGQSICPHTSWFSINSKFLNWLKEERELTKTPSPCHWMCTSISRIAKELWQKHKKDVLSVHIRAQEIPDNHYYNNHNILLDLNDIHESEMGDSPFCITMIND